MSNQKKTDNEQLMKWWREARFGMFIHWGLYAVPAGVWKGKDVPGIGEWIMHREKIPLKEYRPLAADLNPIKFDAKAWVKLAKDAGMKYLVITAKHHDGFAMYDSACSDYDIVDCTPWGKDPMVALARECKKVGIKPIQIYPGSPWENGYNERFNGTLRNEILNAEWFSNVKQAQIVINRWLRQYNHIRPHQALNMRPPVPETLSQSGT